MLSSSTRRSEYCYTTKTAVSEISNMSYGNGAKFFSVPYFVHFHNYENNFYDFNIICQNIGFVSMSLRCDGIDIREWDVNGLAATFVKAEIVWQTILSISMALKAVSGGGGCPITGKDSRQHYVVCVNGACESYLKHFASQLHVWYVSTAVKCFVSICRYHSIITSQCTKSTNAAMICALESVTGHIPSLTYVR